MLISTSGVFDLSPTLCITVGDASAASNPELQQAALDIISVEGRIFGSVRTTKDVCASISRHALNSGAATA